MGLTIIALINDESHETLCGMTEKSQVMTEIRNK
jgi:hypothetical protein